MSNYPQDLDIDEIDPLTEPCCEACKLSEGDNSED